MDAPLPPTPPPFPQLSTPRLLLRATTADDAPALFDIHSDVEAMRWYGTDPLPDLAAAQKMVENFAALRQQANPGVRWGLVRRDSGDLIGTCGLFKWNRSWRSCAVGYELGRQAWGAGYMHEALTAAFAWGFEAMALERIEAQVHPENQASRQLLLRLGFVSEGLAREGGFWGGRRQDLEHFGLLRREARLDLPGIARMGP